MKLCGVCYTKEAQVGRNVCRSCRHQAFISNRGSLKRSRVIPTDDLKILLIDIETQPNLAHVWSIWNQNIGINQLVDVTEMMCFSAKWYGNDEVLFHANWHEGGRDGMVAKAWDLMNEAHVVVTYYGTRFDRPHLNREFLIAGFPPPSPSKDIDLKFAVSKRFKFTSAKLQHVSEQLGLTGKVEHEGFPLWTKVMAGDQDAQERMEEYNRRDVTLMEEVLEILLPWIPSFPSRHLYGGNGCPTCGAEVFIDAGFAHTTLSKFRQFQCTSCKSFFRDSKRIQGAKIQGVNW